MQLQPVYAGSIPFIFWHHFSSPNVAYPVSRASNTAAAAAGLQREYDADGALLEVRSRTAILGSWAGDRM